MSQKTRDVCVRLALLTLVRESLRCETSEELEIELNKCASEIQGIYDFDRRLQEK